MSDLSLPELQERKENLEMLQFHLNILAAPGLTKAWDLLGGAHYSLGGKVPGKTHIDSIMLLLREADQKGLFDHIQLAKNEVAVAIEKIDRVISAIEGYKNDVAGEEPAPEVCSDCGRPECLEAQNELEGLLNQLGFSMRSEEPTEANEPTQMVMDFPGSFVRELLSGINPDELEPGTYMVTPTGIAKVTR